MQVASDGVRANLVKATSQMCIVIMLIAGEQQSQWERVTGDTPKDMT